MQLFRSREPDRAVCTWQHNGPRAPRIAAYLSFEHDGMSTRRTVLVQLQPGGKRPFAEFSTGQGLPFLRRLRVPKGAAMAALCGRTLLCILACCTVCAVVMPAAALTVSVYVCKATTRLRSLHMLPSCICVLTSCHLHPLMPAGQAPARTAAAAGHEDSAPRGDRVSEVRRCPACMCASRTHLIS